MQKNSTSGSNLVLFFKDVENRDAADKLAGAKIFVERGSLPLAGEKHYYWADLIGFSVSNLDGERLGAVSGFIETGAHDVMQVLDNRERLIPFVIDVYIIEVDVELKNILVDWHKEE